MRTIKSRRDFSRVFSQGRRYNHPLVRLIVARAANEGDPGRVAFVAAKRLGNSVYRNRSKRVLREAARSCGLPLAGSDVILFATQGTASAAPDQMIDGLSSVMSRAGLHV